MSDILIDSEMLFINEKENKIECKLQAHIATAIEGEKYEWKGSFCEMWEALSTSCCSTKIGSHLIFNFPSALGKVW